MSKYWRLACIVPVYRGKGDRRKRPNSRGFSILSKPWKIFGMILKLSSRGYEKVRMQEQ